MSFCKAELYLKGLKTPFFLKIAPHHNLEKKLSLHSELFLSSFQSTLALKNSSDIFSFNKKDLLFFLYLGLLAFLAKKRKTKGALCKLKIWGDQSEANGGTDFLLEDNFLFPLKIKETKRKKLSVKAERAKFKKTIETSEPTGELKSKIYKVKSLLFKEASSICL